MKPFVPPTISRVALVFAACTLAVSLALLGARETSAAKPVQGGSFGPGAGAFWEYENPDGSFTFVGVFAGEFRPLGGSPQESTETVFVEISTFFPGDPGDPSDDQVRFISGGADLTEGQFTLSGRRLDSASLEVNLLLEECTISGDPPTVECEPITVAIGLDWTATGGISTQHGSFHFRDPDCTTNQHFSFRGRPAEVLGSVEAGGTEYTRGTGFGDLVISSRDMFVAIGDCFFGEPPPEG